MTSPQITYLAAVGVYILFFLLFARFFIWKRYADERYWRRRPALSRAAVARLAAQNGRDIPRFSIIVPARNEAEVIGRTIDHLLSLDYDPDLFEILIVTDEKETQVRDRHRIATLQAAVTLLEEGRSSPTKEGRLLAEQEVVLGLLAGFAVSDYVAGRREYRRLTLHMAPDAGELELTGPAERHAVAVSTLAGRLLRSPAPLSLEELRRAARLAAASPDPRRTDLSASVHLALAVPVAVAFSLVTGLSACREPAVVVGRAGQAREKVTAHILAVMSGLIARGLASRLRSEDTADRLKDLLAGAYLLRFPATQDVVEERLAAIERSLGATPAASRALPLVKHIAVPADFDGCFQGRRTGHEVPSTKGRALNWALAFTDPRSESYGFYDAESRPDRAVLLYVALRRVSGDPSAALLQGPAFQVRNFFRMGALCRVASLYQAIAHDWYLPALFKRLPFVGGTNLFIDRDLLNRAEGFDSTSLTEDLELGIRAYLKCGAWPEFLPYASSEQTPPTLAGFFRQRLRWGAGHLQVMDKVRAVPEYQGPALRRIMRTLWLKGQFEWTLYQAATLIPPLVIALNATGRVDPTILPPGVRLFIGLFGLIYPCFTFYAYFRYYRFIDPLDRDPGVLRQVGVCLQLLVLPLAAFCFPLPYTAALILKLTGRQPRHWVKTPRTAE
jgi:cellulose synthase/poly-beta-1,6-N-acetylglucosamine synthase-like glycosyltransferase